MSAKTHFFLEVRPRLPAELARLEELAGNLIYSWDRQVRGLFFRLDKELWEACDHHPKLFLRRIAQQKLQQAVEDPIYMQDYARVVSSVDAYLNKQTHRSIASLLDGVELISYSCAEFGLHESLPIYSGGLGILAGDHCKAASDLGLPLVAMGILYRKGYFSQQIDGGGNQIVQYKSIDFDQLAVFPVLNTLGEPLRFTLQLLGETVHVQIWRANVGHVTLYLLDTNVPENSDFGRQITHQLYGGDSLNRLRQEFILGVGGVRAHQLLGLRPSVWHINEGHAAFQIVERCRELVVNHGVDFETALEAVAASTVFTTHTPVPAGHDIFSRQLVMEYFAPMAEEMGISMERFLALGATPDSAGFNMTTLALRGSRYHNGVSRIHGQVSSVMETALWPEVPPESNPIGHITNGVHVPTFLASDWVDYFDAHFGGGWRNQLQDTNYWQVIDTIRDHNFWSIRESLKVKMLESVHERYTRQLRRNGVSESTIRRRVRYIDPRKTDVLTIGFARRFATYKRATLLFSNPEKLLDIIAHEKRPVVFIFGGKAHPSDQPGQQLIRDIHHLSQDKRFEGRVILLEDYDMALARKLVTGVDVWLNTPIHPLEASGTSGEKAAINGVLNLSVLDGWWAEGFDGENGWGITAHGERYPADFRDQEENSELLEILENEVVPLYFDRNGHGYSSGWIEMSKRSMKTLIPVYNAERMVTDYLRNYYRPAAVTGARLAADGYQLAQTLAQWKAHIHRHWPEVSLSLAQQPGHCIYRDQAFDLQVDVTLGPLTPQEVRVECLIGYGETEQGSDYRTAITLEFVERLDNGSGRYRLAQTINLSGHHCYVVRAYPYHPDLVHAFELGCMKWL